MDRNLNSKYHQLKTILQEMGRIIVCMSAGVDSILLAEVVNDVLGDEMIAVTADSPSMPRRELRAAIELAEKYSIPHRVIQTI